MKKFLKNVVIVIYAAIAIAVTICLLSFNEYRISEFGEYSLVIIEDEEMGENYKRGDLVITNKKDKVEVGDDVFYYNTYSKDITVDYARVNNIEKITDKEYTYTLKESTQLSSQYVLGNANKSTKIPVLGTILKVLESKWGFLLLIVLPSFVAFLYELVEVIGEIRKNKGNK